MDTSSRLISAFTLAAWLLCAAVSLIGMVSPDHKPRPARKVAPPVLATVIHVQIAKEASVPPMNDRRAIVTDAVSLPKDSPPPATPTVAPFPPAPTMQVVVEPSKAVAFALPTTGPTTAIADPKQAVPTRASTTAQATPDASANATPVQRIVYGQGEGRQPAPEYPREAVIAREQGTVVVRFVVGEDGHVESAEAATPSPFAILNRSAVRTIREDWRFSPGPTRTYEVSIEFKLKSRSN